MFGRPKFIRGAVRLTKAKKLRRMAAFFKLNNKGRTTFVFKIFKNNSGLSPNTIRILFHY